MEVEYGVGIKNRFAFLVKDDDNDEDDCGNVTVAIASSKPASVKKLPSATKDIVKHENNNKTNNAGDSSNRSAALKDKIITGKNPQILMQEDERKSTKANVRFSEEKSYQGSGSRGFRRGGGGSNRRNYRGRYDNSSENRSSTENGNTEEAPDKQATLNDQNDATENEAVMEKMELDENPEEENENAKNAERTLTLTEWKALQAPREKPKFNIRKPGEGEITTKLEKLVLKKREDDIVNQGEDYETDEVYYPQRAGKMKQISDVGFTTGYQKRRGGRFGGSSTRVGGGDGYQQRDGGSEQMGASEKPRGRPRYGPRGARQNIASVPRFDDASDFPTLG